MPKMEKAMIGHAQSQALRLVRQYEGDRKKAELGLRLLMADEAMLRDAVMAVGIAKLTQDATACYRNMVQQVGAYRASHPDE